MFLFAEPVWLKEKETEMNCRVRFKAICKAASSAEIHIATSGIYQLWINGIFVSYGPARAGKGCFRMDSFNIGKYLTEKENTVVIEVAGYYCKSFYILQQPSFLQAEIVSENNCLAATGKDFSARLNPYYYRKIQRYSYQRTFAEGYNYQKPTDSFLTDGSLGNAETETVSEKKIIERRAPYPIYEKISAEPLFSGRIEHRIPKKYVFDRYCEDSNIEKGLITGFKQEELECMPEKEYQEFEFFPGGDYRSALGNMQYSVYKLPYNATGMLCFDISCDGPVTLYISGDEIITDGRINPVRERVCNIIRLELPEGCRSFQSFEVYTMQYIQISCISGSCRISNLSMVEYKHPPVREIRLEDADMQLIADAAVETFRQNAVDVFTDCPSRERAGWLCDSYFIGKAEKAITGGNVIEESFLENFLHEDRFAGLPEGMLPMCYPADVLSGSFIPNWAMWFVVELADYLKRTGNREFTDRFREKVYALIRYFSRFENEDGLLESLEGWIFVEWSRANDEDMICGVNYPSNMMYYAMLRAASGLYGDSELAEKAEKIKKTIIEQSFDGTFYVDHAERKDGRLVPVNEITEVCQYYALFCGISDPQSQPDFFERMKNEFGPQRDTSKVWREVYPAAPFIGNCLRLEVLTGYGYKDEVLRDIRGYFLHMAETTGTLWEKATTENSCNHGFTGCIIAWLKELSVLSEDT